MYVKAYEVRVLFLLRCLHCAVTVAIANVIYFALLSSRTLLLLLFASLLHFIFRI